MKVCHFKVLAYSTCCACTQRLKLRRCRQTWIAFPVLLILLLSFEKRTQKTESTIHIALIFTEKYFEGAFQVINSYLEYNEIPAVFHLISDSIDLVHTRIQNITTMKFLYHLYKLRQSDSGRLLSGYLYDKPANQLDMIKLSLHEIIKHDKVLYLDTDVTIVSDISRCFFRDLNGSSLMALGVDMGSVCQDFPEKCWPLSQAWEVPSELICKTAKEDIHSCSSNKIRSFLYNFGVALMDLKRMRKQNFTKLLLNSAAQNGLIVGHKKANFGGQDFLNGMLLQYPEIIEVLPCGCNYQVVGVARKLLCPNEKIVISHLWYVSSFLQLLIRLAISFFGFFHRSATLTRQGMQNDPFVLHYHHFMHGGKNLKKLPEFSPSVFNWQRPPYPIVDPSCQTQNYSCKLVHSHKYN